ncbi:leucine-rich PPR motif-containing protein, mitochondrial [Manduca sexta]|uniref:Leucine-rich PPR motif-containing protein, mitochondrial n=1 Tax=Manduca sexta TaxID=7130 RepID=A0A922CH44_MANSE|nr:leucine-rich PPR motif-containing protein, mitochondrial [Manduca sexta]KAG6445714.1 hypothetical protein O3G_MSEX004032 [Manduca sexta]
MSSLLRSTKFVRYFTGAARTLILNSAKTAEANAFANPKALCAANNVFLRDYATTKKTESLEPLLQKLDSEVRRFGRITKKDIDEVFDELQSKNDITSSQSLLVIRCCGELVPEELPEQRTLLVQKIWGVLTERGIPMDISHYNALLRVYVENEHPFSPAQFLEELERKGLQPNRVTYQRLMWRYCQEGDVEGATKVLEKMRELHMPVSEPVLNALVMGHAFHGDTDGAKAVLETMAGAGLQPSNRTYTLLACGYAKQGNIDGVQNVIKTAKDKDAFMTDKDILDIIEHLTLGGHGDKVDQLFEHLQKGIGYNQDVCNLILRLLNKGHDDVAKKIMGTMPRASSTGDTPFKGAFFIKQLLRLNRSSDNIVKSCKELMSENLVPNALYIATECALQQGNIELAEKLFDELHQNGVEIRQHYYWPLLAHRGKEKDEEGLLQIIRNMTTKGLAPSGEALRDYVIPYLIGKDKPHEVILKLQLANVPVMLAARNLIIELLESGKTKQAAEIALQYRPRGQYALFARSLIGALNKTKDIKSFVTILHVISSKPTNIQTEQDSANDDVQEDDNDINEVGRIVKTGIKYISAPEMREQLLEALYAKGIRISTETAEAIEQYLGENMTTNQSNLLSKLTSSDLEAVPIESSRQSGLPRSPVQLEQLLAKINDTDNNYKNRIRKQLITAYMKNNDVDKLDMFLEQLKSTDFTLSNGLLSQLFEFYCENGDIDKALKCKDQILANSPNFVFSRFKSIIMAYALVKTDRYDEAVQLLKDNRPSELESAGFLLNSKCWQLLNTLAEKKDEVKVKEMTNILIENNYVEPSNVILGPLIKVHMLKDDLESALKEFEHCCKQYRCTPWKGELMKVLIMREDANKLQWLADISTQIHGEVNILHDLVLAFVECGRLRQARRILETPGLQTRNRRLENACQRYVEEGKSEHLEGLLEATRELSHIDRSNIFYHLLISYCKEDQTDKALGLWTILQEDGEIPSDQFLQHLGAHLKSKNRNVPFVIPEEILKKNGSKKETNAKVNQTQAGESITKNSVSSQIESLINEGNLDQATDITLKAFEVGNVPKHTVLKYLLKTLGEAGEVEKIQQLSKYINESLRRRLAFDNKMILAVFKRGAASQHVDNLLQSVEAAQSHDELKTALIKFPRSTALASIIDKPEDIKKCKEVAEIAATKGDNIPINLIWMEYILAGKDKEAQEIWDKYLIKAPVVIFRRLLQASHTCKDPQIIEKLISTLETNKVLQPSSLGNAYSRLINYHVLENNLEDALKVLEKAVQSGLQLADINKTSLARLKAAAETAGKEFKYSV